MAGQGANNGPSQAAGSQFVKFTLASAQRIAKTVRTVEAGNRSQAGVVFEHPLPSSSRKPFRICKHDNIGGWAINAEANVTFAFQTATPNTAVARNLFFDIPAYAGTYNCAIARDGTSWYLVQYQHRSTAVLTGATLLADSLTFDRYQFEFIGRTTSPITIGVTACTATT